jgi:heme exporter protein B
MGAFLALVRRDLLLATRIGGGGLTGLMFFLSLIVLAPFAIGPDLNLLARIGPALLWISALLSSLLGLDRLFQADEEDGSLDLLQTGPLSMLALVSAKCLAHWLTTGLPLAIAAPILGLLLALDPDQLALMALSLLIGTPALTALGAAGAALTVSLRRGGLLISVIAMPVMIPILIFGVATVNAPVLGLMLTTTPLKILVGLSLACVTLGLATASAALGERGS